MLIALIEVLCAAESTIAQAITQRFRRAGSDFLSIVPLHYLKYCVRRNPPSHRLSLKDSAERDYSVGVKIY